MIEPVIVEFGYCIMNINELIDYNIAISQSDHP